MTKYLVEFSRSWADEFQAEGLCIFDEKRLEKLKRWIAFGKASFYFGTNESFGEYDGDYLEIEDFTFTPISEGDEEALKRLIPSFNQKYYQSFGQFPDNFEDDLYEMDLKNE